MEGKQNKKQENQIDKNYHIPTQDIQENGKSTLELKKNRSQVEKNG